MSYNESYNYYREKLLERLTQYCPREAVLQKSVEDAMQYSLMAGGKRLRGVLVLAFNDICGGDIESALSAACAIEMIHAYSLIHDDLPCMDDDDIRRGKPTCHIKYGEATAVLAGDGLLTKAFEIVATDKHLSAEQKVAIITQLSQGAGTRGMIGGQIIDIENENKQVAQDVLEQMHLLKTGALIKCSSVIGCMTANADEKTILFAEKYSELLGFTFQVVDDILDMISTVETLGKPIGSDVENGKSTYVTLLGLDGATKKVDELLMQTNQLVASEFPTERFLVELATEMASRKN